MATMSLGGNSFRGIGRGSMVGVVLRDVFVDDMDCVASEIEVGARRI